MNKKMRNLITEIKNKINQRETILEELKKTNRERTKNSVKNKLLQLYRVESLLFDNYQEELDFDILETYLSNDRYKLVIKHLTKEEK